MNNLAKRTVFGTLYLVVLLGGLLAGPFGFAAIGAFAIGTMMDEFFRMTMGEKYIPCRIVAVASAIILFGLVFAYKGFGLDPKFLAAGIVPVLALLVLTVLSKDRSDVDALSDVFTALVWPAAPVILCNFLVFKEGEYSAVLLIGFFVILWMSDIGAYCIGTLFGQKENSRKLCPAISPKKSWVGYWGGLVFALVTAAILSKTDLLPFSLPNCLVTGFLIHFFGVFGDLFESQWKRRYGLKDSGKIIPGHGGMLDRLDSSLFAMPAAAVYLAILGLI